MNVLPRLSVGNLPRQFHKMRVFALSSCGPLAICVKDNERCQNCSYRLAQSAFISKLDKSY